jgi:tetraacyldisaccharide 4'-kinase
MNAFGAGLGWMGSLMMERVVNIRNRGFDKGRHVHDVGLPVVSVGNLSVGGTGKSPMVRWVSKVLLNSGHAPAIALRGYKSQEGVSDEAIEHQQLFPDIPVLVGSNRVRTIANAVQSGALLDCVVLDDGFQHRFVKRDLDLVLVDARRPPDTDWLLPRGRLREPARNLRRADVVVVTHADHAAPTLRQRLADLHGSEPLATCVHVWESMTRIDPDGQRQVAVDTLNGLKVVTRLGIAKPEGVRRMLPMHGATVVADVPAKDHQAVRVADLDQLAAAAVDADAIVVSAKDMATMGPLLASRSLPVPVLVPRLTLRFLTGDDALRKRVNGIFQ